MDNLDFLNSFDISNDDDISDETIKEDLESEIESSNNVKQEGINVLFEISNENYKPFIKLLDSLKKSEYLSIVNSKISQTIGSLSIFVDIKHLVGENITFRLMEPEKKIELLKALDIKGNDESVIFSEDLTNNRYIVSKGQYNLLIPVNWDINLDEFNIKFDNLESVGKTITIDKSDAQIVHKTFKNRDNKENKNNLSDFNILLFNNQFKGVNISGTANIFFPPFHKEKLDETKATKVLLSNGFLMVDGNAYKIQIGKENDDYWMRTLIDTGIVHNEKSITIEVFEQLREETLNDII